MQLETNYQSLISQLSQLSDEQLKRDYLNHLEWTQPIASMLPLINDVEALRMVRLALDVDLMLGAFLAGKVKPELQSETVSWVGELEISNELKLKLLTKTKSKLAVSFLEEFIKNIPDEPDKLHVYEIWISQAVKELKNIDEKLFTRMQLNLLQDEHQWIRKIAIKVFKNYIDDSAIPILIKFLKDEDVQIRYKAVIALGRIAGKSVLENIIEALDDKSPTVRGIAISVLASIAGKDILQKIVCFVDDENYIVRSQTVCTLAKIGGELAEELIIHVFLDEYDNLSKRVFEVLTKIDRNKGIQLIFLASQSDDAKVRRKAALFLGNIVKTPDRVSDLPVLVELLNDENSQVCKTAAKALTLPKTGMESPEFEALRDEYKELRWKAEIDIEEIIMESDFTTLLLKSQDFNYYVRSAAEKVIKYQIAAVKDIKASFFKALLHENYLIRSAATTYLGKIYGKSVIPNLLKALQDEHPKVRSNAV
ncbi:MAG: HEAT repeat domain-containing protein [Rivularia sp. (in: cyanobacteria)]